MQKIINGIAILGLILGTLFLFSGAVQEFMIAGYDDQSDGLECVYNCEHYEQALNTLGYR